MIFFSSKLMFIIFAHTKTIKRIKLNEQFAACAEEKYPKT